MQKIIRIDLGTVNCYLLSVNGKFILVDTGGFTFQGNPLDDKCALLDTKLAENGCFPGSLSAVLLTHGDLDHIANCRYLQEKYKVKIFIHQADLSLTRDLTAGKVLSNLKFASPAMKAMSFLMGSLIRKMIKKIVAAYQEFTVDGFIDERTDLSQYGLDARVILLPGHTKGSIGILTNDGDLISGDVFANIRKPGLAINALDFAALRKTVASLTDKNIRTVYPGHGTPFAFNDLKDKHARRGN